MYARSMFYNCYKYKYFGMLPWIAYSDFTWSVYLFGCCRMASADRRRGASALRGDAAPRRDAAVRAFPGFRTRDLPLKTRRYRPVRSASPRTCRGASGSQTPSKTGAGPVGCSRIGNSAAGAIVCSRTGATSSAVATMPSAHTVPMTQRGISQLWRRTDPAARSAREPTSLGNIGASPEGNRSVGARAMPPHSVPDQDAAVVTLRNSDRIAPIS